MAVTLIADSGATKCEWVLLNSGRKKTVITMGISPYFLSPEQIAALLRTELLPKLKSVVVEEVFFYGTGLSNPNNVSIISKTLKKTFAGAKVQVSHDLMGAARALCGDEKGIACILGTGSNCCFFNGKKTIKNTASLGYVLGDEGSGANLGKKVIQYYLYNTFDEDLRARFDARFTTNYVEILENVYKKPLANKYLASFTIFLAENRGHYMVENIIEDGLNDFFFHHVYKYRESWRYPINFIGSVAFGFKDVLKEMCTSYELELGKVLKAPMDGLVKYHSK
jgi:N-acetylglucosamine kinase-like BadF-type ATPase